MPRARKSSVQIKAFAERYGKRYTEEPDGHAKVFGITAKHGAYPDIAIPVDMVHIGGELHLVNTDPANGHPAMLKISQLKGNRAMGKDPSNPRPSRYQGPYILE